MQLIAPKSEAKYLNPYELMVLRRIEECLDHGSQTLQTIFRACEGAYPTVVLDCIREFYDDAQWVRLVGLDLRILRTATKSFLS